MKEFLDMGGYAAFVWPSYAVTFAVVAAERHLGAPRAARRRARAARRRLAARGEPA